MASFIGNHLRKQLSMYHTEQLIEQHSLVELQSSDLLFLFAS